MSKPTDRLIEGHDFDGIREYDNPLPTWWVTLFILTTIFGAIYYFHYHISGMGQSTAKEYSEEIKNAEKATLVFLKNTPQSAPVVQSKDAGSLSAGKDIYVKNCAVCHGKNGEGNIGPNLTDKFWIHGNKFEDLVNIITNGVEGKGMIAWKTTLRPDEMGKVASYILTMQDTNPPNAKAPQGNLYEN
ncbi:MAG: cytochrome c class [Ignavibacteria bacterium]|nr:cytochrome c class [Ignavibacteria bacterium]